MWNRGWCSILHVSMESKLKVTCTKVNFPLLSHLNNYFCMKKYLPLLAVVLSSRSRWWRVNSEYYMLVLGVNYHYDGGCFFRSYHALVIFVTRTKDERTPSQAFSSFSRPLQGEEHKNNAKNYLNKMRNKAACLFLFIFWYFCKSSISPTHLLVCTCS